jgi:hypothetical protein
MEQTFADLCHEHLKSGKNLFPMMVHIYWDTFSGIVRAIFFHLIMKRNILLRPVIITALVLLIPFVASLFTAEMQWDETDYIVIGVLVFATAMAYEIVARRSRNTLYRVAVAIAVIAGLLLYWANLAVGLIGNEDNPANLLFFLVPWVGVIGSAIVRFKARGMARAMLAVIIAQLSVPLVAFLIWQPPVGTTQEFGGVLQVIVVTAFFALPWAVAALLFRQAAAAGEKEQLTRESH